MTANEWLEVMKQASDFPKGMEKLIVKYGEMLIEEHDSKVKKLNEPAVINNEASALSERVAVCCQTCKYVDGFRCNEGNGGCELDEYECWEQQTDL